mmetsp:Transcript_14123/g.38790  ORF Transcript_14123/g.38790 Transcript_14123/m.38790 type:complete len:210 (+) Transcript_14123:128-757(+)
MNPSRIRHSSLRGGDERVNALHLPVLIRRAEQPRFVQPLRLLIHRIVHGVGLRLRLRACILHLHLLELRHPIRRDLRRGARFPRSLLALGELGRILVSGVYRLLGRLGLRFRLRFEILRSLRLVRGVDDLVRRRVSFSAFVRHVFERDGVGLGENLRVGILLHDVFGGFRFLLGVLLRVLLGVLGVLLGRLGLLLLGRCRLSCLAGTRG